MRIFGPPSAPAGQRRALPDFAVNSPALSICAERVQQRRLLDGLPNRPPRHRRNSLEPRSRVRSSPSQAQLQSLEQEPVQRALLLTTALALPVTTFVAAAPFSIQISRYTQR